MTRSKLSLEHTVEYWALTLHCSNVKKDPTEHETSSIKVVLPSVPYLILECIN